MLSVLTIFGWILLCIVVLVIWIIIVPRVFYIEYTKKDGITVKVRIFIFKIKIYPINFSFSPKKVRKLKPEQDKKNSNTEEETSYEFSQKYSKEKKADTTKKDDADNPTLHKKPKHVDKSNRDDKQYKDDSNDSSFEEVFLKIIKNKDVIKKILSTVKGVLKILLNGITIADISFIVPISTEDAQETQRKYANVTSAFYTLSIILQKYLKIYYKKPIFIADFAQAYTDKTYFYCKISASPSILLVMGIYLFKQYKNIMKEINKRRN